MTEENIPFAVPAIGQDEIEEVVDSLESGWITTGPKVRQFEEAFAEYVNAEHAVATNSCTAGLHLALKVLGVGPGDEVIVPTMTFCATANVVLHLGADPVLVDVGPDGNVLPEAVEGAITEDTKAVMPVHYAGQPCDLKEIYALATKHGIHVVEDAAHAVGAAYRGHKVGTDALGPTLLEGTGLHSLVVFSFYANKNMTTSEGGMLVTRSDELADRFRRLLLHGMSEDAWMRYSDRGSWYYEVTEAGYKYNMTDVQAALGIHQLRRLDRFIEIRRRRAETYMEELANTDGLRLPRWKPDRHHAAHLFPVVLDLDRLAISRDQFINELDDRNISTSVHFIPLHLHPVHRDRGYREGDFPVAERFYAGEVSLPLHPKLTEENAIRVAQAVRDILETGGGTV